MTVFADVEIKPETLIKGKTPVGLAIAGAVRGDSLLIHIVHADSNMGRIMLRKQLSMITKHTVGRAEEKSNCWQKGILFDLAVEERCKNIYAKIHRKNTFHQC